jgi:alpha-tubulin suppressor-like RCC1 family protein
MDGIVSRRHPLHLSFPLLALPLKLIKSTFISRVACGLEHALLLTSSGFVYSMGKNNRGQLGGEVQNVAAEQEDSQGEAMD